MTCGVRSAHSGAIEGEASSHYEATPPPIQLVAPIWDAPTIWPPPLTLKPPIDVISQLLSTLEIWETRQCLIGNQGNQGPVSTPVPTIVESILDEPAQGITLANVDNLSAARRPASLSEGPTVFLTQCGDRGHVQVRNGKTHATSTSLDLKPHYSENQPQSNFSWI